MQVSTNNKIKICPPQELTLGEQQTTKVRDDRIDSVKFWLITLVIAAHVFARKEFADSTVCVVVYNWIRLFAMPLFIFISGYFSRKKDLGNFLPSIWKLLEPLIIFQIIALLFYVDTLSIRKILTPWYMLWYLLSLMYWRIILQIIPDKVLLHKKLILICTFCISILAGFLPFDRFLSIQRTLSLMPFFFLGYFMKDKNLYLPSKNKLYSIFFLLVILVILFFYPHNISYLHHATPYKSIYGIMIRAVAFILAVPMSIAFLNVCYNTKYFARQGRMSMQYYIYHAFLVPANTAQIIPPLIMIVSKLNYPMSFATAVVIILGTILGLSLVLNVPYIRMLTNPSLFLIKSKNSTPPM